jgi:hypothetical protein
MVEFAKTVEELARRAKQLTIKIPINFLNGFIPSP